MMSALKTSFLLVFATLSLQAWGVEFSSKANKQSARENNGTYQTTNGVSSSQASDDTIPSIFGNGFEFVPSPPAITGFEASLTSLSVGDSTTLNWSTENTSSCTPSNGTGGWDSLDIDVPSGSAQVEISTEGTHEFNLTCFGSLGQVDSTVAVTATSLPPACDVGLTSSTMKEWNTFFGTAWPGPTSREMRVTIPEFGYFAVHFETGDVVDSGAVATFETSGVTGHRTISISETPGCFEVASECKGDGRGSSMGWNTTGSGGGCHLKPNTSYYWNVTFTDGFTPSSSSCEGTFCLTFLWVLNTD